MPALLRMALLFWHTALCVLSRSAAWRTPRSPYESSCGSRGHDRPALHSPWSQCFVASGSR